MKIVVAVGEDKKSVFKRTGQCAFFAVFEDANAVAFVENAHHDGGHEAHSHHHDESHEQHEAHTNSHKKDVESLRGCDVILVQAVGENMREALESIGLKIVKVREKDGATAEELVKNFLAKTLA